MKGLNLFSYFLQKQFKFIFKIIKMMGGFDKGVDLNTSYQDLSIFNWSNLATKSKMDGHLVKNFGD